MGVTTHRSRSAGGVNRAAWAAGYAAIASACAISIWPIVTSGSIPAMQQDWAWPISRAGDLQWLHAFIGLWDERSLGQANALPWQAVAVVPAALLVLAFGASAGLALWLFVLAFGAACACGWLLRQFDIRGTAATLIPAAFYAFGPVAFTRLAAGHLPYLAAYALLPIALGYAKRSLQRRDARHGIMFGLTLGLCGCQVQFLAMGGLAVALMALALRRTAGWVPRLGTGLALSVTVQLPWLLPLALSSTASLYAAQPPLLSFEYNNSAPVASAAVGLGYFTHYYESHALPAAFWVLYVLIVAALAGGLWANRRGGAYALALAVVGFVLVAGLYGPLSAPLAWSFSHAGWFEAFRDLHYFAALTALGAALALGLVLEALPSVAAVPALAMVAWIAIPLLGAGAVRDLIVPRADVEDAVSDMQTIAARGPGRVLWLPAEEPLGLAGSKLHGRDFTAYGPSGNSSVSDAFQNAQLAYALATLRAGRPDWDALRAMNVRYLVFRRYVRAGRNENFGTGLSMAFAGVSDAGIGVQLKHSRTLRRLRSTALSDTYELPDALAVRYPATADAGALLFSQLRPGRVATIGTSARFDLHVSNATADPRDDWVAGRFGWRERAWLPDSIWPFAWTLSTQPGVVPGSAAAACVLAGALPHGAELHSGTRSVRVHGTWRRYRLSPGGESVILPVRGDLTAIASVPCAPPKTGRSAAVLAYAAGYDRGWRLRERGRWVTPILANGWMMAWPSADPSASLTYLPAYAQAAGAALAVLVFGLTAAASKRR